MEKGERQKFTTLFQALCAYFRVEATVPLAEAYWIGLESMPFEQVKAAIGKAFVECEFMPVAATLRKLVAKKQFAAPYHAPIPVTLCTFHSYSHPGEKSDTGGVDWCHECRNVKRLEAAARPQLVAVRGDDE